MERALRGSPKTLGGATTYLAPFVISYEETTITDDSAERSGWQWCCHPVPGRMPLGACLNRLDRNLLPQSGWMVVPAGRRRAVPAILAALLREHALGNTPALGNTLATRVAPRPQTRGR